MKKLSLAFAFFCLLVSIPSCRKDKTPEKPLTADTSAYPPDIFGLWILNKVIEQDTINPIFLNVDHNNEAYYNSLIQTYEVPTIGLTLSNTIKYSYSESISKYLNANYTGSTNDNLNAWHINEDGTFMIYNLSQTSSFTLLKLDSYNLVITTIQNKRKKTYYFNRNSFPSLTFYNSIESKLLGTWHLKTRTNGAGTVVQSYDTTQIMTLSYNHSASPGEFYSDTLLDHAFYGSSTIENGNDPFTSSFLGANKWYCRNADHFMIGTSPSKIISLTDNNLTVQTYSPIVGEVILYNFER